MNKNVLKKYKVTLKLNPKKWHEANYGSYYHTILLFITNRCNLRCSTCFNKHNIKGHEEMSFNYIKKIIDNNPLVTKYDIMGGEPLMHTNLNRILSYLESKNKKIGLYTNGILLNKLKKNYKNLRLNLSFHSIYSINNSLKPITLITNNIKEFELVYPIKICFLLSNDNKKMILPFVDYIENTFKGIKKITIGTLRDEADYWNDEQDNILALEEYGKLIQNFLNKYTGRLNLDIFTEGILDTPNLPTSQFNQINRFKSVFINNKYSECLYDIGMDVKVDFDPNKPIKFKEYKKCPRYGKARCLTDKIKLIRV